jgi:type II secretory pathway pseudopilin PulG
MTLFEALVALVILGASAAGFLGVFQNGARAVESAEAWNRASAAAQSAVEEAVRAAKEGTEVVRADTPGVQTTTTTQPWSAGVEDIAVQVVLPDGRTLTVHRLVRQERLR